ncbi:Nuclear pore complex protein NUP54 [Raphanus sativus]|uniref:Nuclear pore complex protein NUP54 n=1 Tax=Raphanus sativus TaxID=3726 RepID=A0A6J0KI42_RAPSA|nr:nuclear pore complex protein NUP54 [Raphanus sativus]KAJ4879814.1 Nuclear pore complex protein NUP54 [Raphanus sativus]
MFGTPSSSPAFGTPSSTPMFGSSSSPAFGTPPPSMFGTPSSTPAFGTPSSTPAFGTPSTSSFASGGFGTSLFSTPFSSQQQQQQQQQQTSPFQQQPAASSGFGFQSPFNTMQQTPQLTTQMAPVAPIPFSLADRDIQAIVEAYKEDPTNPKYAFKHLLFSVTEQQYRVKPAAVSDIMWAEAMSKLEGMDSSERERLWPQLVQGFKDLSQRLKLQDEVLVSDRERIKTTQSNVKMLQRHLQAHTFPSIERLRQKEQNLQRRMLRVMRIVEGLEGKGFRLPLTKGEAELSEKLTGITRQVKGPGAELSRRVQSLQTICRAQANSFSAGSSIYLPGSTKIDEQSLVDMQEVLQQETEAIGRLGNVLKRDMRDMEIMVAEDTEMTEDT